MKRLIKIILKYPIKLFNYIYTYFYYKNSQANERIKIDDMLEKKEKILVFSPHVDDETIGLGATLFKHKEIGCKMALVYMTDGGGSTTESSREELIATRKKEGKKVKETYGFESIYFLDEIDGELNPEKTQLVDKIINILEIEKPNIIYTPFLLDGHRDHVGTTKALIQALKVWNKDFEKIYMYEVNFPIMPKLVNSVSKMEEKDYIKKGEIYNIFTSQWAMGFDAFRLLDRRKKYIINSAYGAEVFVRVDLETLLEIEKALEEEEFAPEQFRQLSSHYNLLFAFRNNKDLKEKYAKRINTILEKTHVKVKE